MTEQQKNKLKQIQLEMFIEFIRVCEKEHLQWFVVGGTALGAVRHSGFIPWDDDIDVAMPREDYDKFIKVAQPYLPKHIFLQTIDTDKEYVNNFAKIRNSNTTYVETSSANMKINHGVYIDVFPLDGFTDKSLLQKVFLFKDRVLRYEIKNIFIDSSKVSRSFFKSLLDNVIRILFSDYKKIGYKRERLLRKYSYEKYNMVSNFCGAWGKKEIMPKSFFGSGVKGSFEGIDVILPEKTDEYLKHLYGKYMELPPAEKQVAHHYCDIIDFEKSYLEYIQDGIE